MVKKLIISSMLLAAVTGCNQNQLADKKNKLDAQNAHTLENVRAGSHVDRVDLNKLNLRASINSEKTYKEKLEDARKQGYMQGIKDAEDRAGRSVMNEKFKSRYWQTPVVQEVKVPAMVMGGMFYPERTEQVVLQPGQYVQYNELEKKEQKRYQLKKVEKKKTMSFEEYMEGASPQ